MVTLHAELAHRDRDLASRDREIADLAARIDESSQALRGAHEAHMDEVARHTVARAVEHAATAAREDGVRAELDRYRAREERHAQSLLQAVPPCGAGASGASSSGGGGSGGGGGGSGADVRAADDADAADGEEEHGDGDGGDVNDGGEGGKMRKKKKKKKGKKLDQSSITEQLRAILRGQGAKIVDVFQKWDVYAASASRVRTRIGPVTRKDTLRRHTKHAQPAPLRPRGVPRPPN